MIDFEIDRTKAFTDEQMAKVVRLPRNEWLDAMARPNSATTMTTEEREKHYVSYKYPALKYHSSGGGGAGSNNPPRS